MAKDMKSEEMKQLALDAIEELKASEITVLDVRELTTITDTMIICTGRSSRHVKSIADNVVLRAKKKRAQYIHMEGEKEGEWVIVDLADVVVHVMQAETRAFYNLEDLWESHVHTITRHRQ